MNTNFVRFLNADPEALAKYWAISVDEAKAILDPIKERYKDDERRRDLETWCLK